MTPAPLITSNLIARSPLWVPVTTRPMAKHLLGFFSQADPFSSKTMCDILEIDLAKDTKLLIDPAHNKGNSAFMAIPFKITERSANVFGTMHGGMSATLVDTITSYHMGEQNLPNLAMHVTTALSTKYLSAGKVGTNVVALSQIDRMGKRLLYSSFRIIEDPSDEVLDSWIATHGGSATTEDKPLFADVPSIQQFVKQYNKVIVTGQHVKMFVDVPIGGAAAKPSAEKKA